MSRVLPALDWVMADVHSDIDRAWRARESVRGMSLDERVRRIEAWAGVFRQNRDDLISLAVGSARSLKKWAVSQVDDVISFCERFRDRARALEPERVDGDDGASLVFEPYGVVGLAAPRNSPYRPLFYSLADALAAGNAVVVWPSSVLRKVAEHSVGLVSAPWGDAVRVTMARGKVATAAFASSPQISVIKMFGNFRTGARFLEAHAQALSAGSVAERDNIGMRRLKTWVMELSGNDPLVVLPDCDVEAAVTAAVQGSFLNSGQVCLCAKRLIIHRDVADDFVHRLVTEVEKLRLGPLDDIETDIGPLIDEASANRVFEQLDQALAAGGVILSGGARDGLAIEPTIVRFDRRHLELGGPRPSLWFDECFGPVRGLVVVDSLEQAYALAADTPQGLGATVFGRPDDCQWLARKLDVGRVVINRNPAALMGSMMPFGGAKDSGVSGAEYSIQMLAYRKLLVQ